MVVVNRGSRVAGRQPDDRAEAQSAEAAGLAGAEMDEVVGAGGDACQGGEIDLAAAGIDGQLARREQNPVGGAAHLEVQERGLPAVPPSVSTVSAALVSESVSVPIDRRPGRCCPVAAVLPPATVDAAGDPAGAAQRAAAVDAYGRRASEPETASLPALITVGPV